MRTTNGGFNAQSIRTGRNHKQMLGSINNSNKVTEDKRKNSNPVKANHQSNLQQIAKQQIFAKPVNSVYDRP